MTTKEPPREVDFAGNTLWECADPNCGSKDGYLSHHASKLPNGDYVVLRWVESKSYTNVIFEEFTPDNKKVWTWDLSKFITIPASASGDWCQGNSITINIDKDEVYVNCRFVGLVKTTYKNPTFQWHLPNKYNATGMGNMTFSPATSQPSDTHDPEIHDDGTILVFDNGGYDTSFLFQSPTATTTFHSRAVEYKIDETKTATLTWEFPGKFNVDSWYKNQWYQPFWGDADRLANSNVLVAAEVRGSGTESRIFEVTRDGMVVWELRLGLDFGVYRAERITPPLDKPVAKQ